MTDKELIRRALLGSRKAQKKCTEKGIVLPYFDRRFALEDVGFIVPGEVFRWKMLGEPLNMRLF